MNALPQTIPYHFDPPPTADVDDENLEIQKLPGGQQVVWRLIGASLFVPEGSGSLEAAEKANGGRLTLHGNFGFSLDTYHEFFVLEPPVTEIGFQMGGVEATFGEVSPLAAFLFEPIRSKWNGWWDMISSLRVLGAAHGDAELVYLNASSRYFDRTGFWPEPLHLGYDDLWLDESEEQKEANPPIFRGAPMSSHIEPMRFLAAAAHQTDDLAACVYYYRVIEYFSFFAHERDISRLRHDQSLADTQFSKKIFDLIIRDERAPIMRLVQRLVDRQMLDDAKRNKLIENISEHEYALKLYEFRNSIVHGKFSYGLTLVSPSVFLVDERATRWRMHLLTLARRAILAHP